MIMGYLRRGMLLCFFLGAMTAWAQIQVEDHWSPYDYPKQIPEGTKYHIIQDGDTLWDLAARYLNDPLLWPQLYQANTYIKDPDLIYPGDPVFLDIGVVVTDESISDTTDDGDGTSGEFTEMEEFAEASEDDGDSVSDRSEETSFLDDSSEFVILPAGDRSDMECSTYLYPMGSRNEKLPFDFQVMGGENRTIRYYGTDDIIYLNKGQDFGVKAGQIYSLRRVLRPVTDPGKRFGGKFLGMAVDQVGRAKVLAVQGSSCTAIVIDGCSEAKIGDFLVPYEQEPIPLITELPVIDRYQGINVDDSGRIIISEDDVMSFGKGHLANVDLGIEENVAPGDLFVIFRDNPSNNNRAGIILPELYLGQAVALKTGPKSTVVKIIEGVTDIHVGDRVVPYTNAFSQSGGGSE
ncbi:LysM peptidoglycan-binding domain-containing protein [Sulfidibacter corallicola]